MTDSSRYAEIAKEAANRVFGREVVLAVEISDYYDHYAGDGVDMLKFRLIIGAGVVEGLDGDEILDANLAMRRAIQRAGEPRFVVTEYADKGELAALVAR